jgi:hypothetical protein
MDLLSFLIQPIQRLPRYVLLLHVNFKLKQLTALGFSCLYHA